LQFGCLLVEYKTPDGSPIWKKHRMLRSDSTVQISVMWPFPDQTNTNEGGCRAREQSV
jgi:hypothetical protein